MNIKFKTKAALKGFSLIEVMIALVILAVGILGISKLQGTLIRSSSDANQRTVAVSIAQQKIDDLKSFVQLTVGSPTDTVPDTWATGIAPTLLAFDHIANPTNNNSATFTGRGGAACAATVAPPACDSPLVLLGNAAGNVSVGNYNYTLDWDVVNYIYAGTPSVATVTASTTDVDFKRVTVNVAWVDEVGDAQAIALDTVIDSYAPALTAFSDNPTAIGNEGPKAGYTPLPAPDVVPVSLESGGTKFKETSVPEPEVTKQDYATVVDFETVTYTNLNIATRREEFVTAACSCITQVSGSPVDHVYGYLEWDAEDEQFVDATYTVTNNNNDQQDFAGSFDIEECGICCRDGQYKVEDPDGDAIVQNQLFGFSNVDQATAGQEDKVCRLKRIDGIYRVVKPWKLIGFNVIPASYFDEDQTSSSGANITAYSSYVETLVRDFLGGTGTNGILDEETDVAAAAVTASQYTVDTTFSATPGIDAGYDAVAVSGSDGLGDHRKIKQGSNDSAKRTIQARAIFLDIPPTGYLVNSGGTDFTAADVPLDRIPFYETNVTSLAGWIPDEDQVAFGAIATDYTDEHDDALQGGSVRDACKSSNVSNTSGNCVSNQELTNKSFGDFERGEFHPYVIQADTVTARMHTSSDGLANDTINSESTIDASVTITVVP